MRVSVCLRGADNLAPPGAAAPLITTPRVWGYSTREGFWNAPSYLEYIRSICRYLYLLLTKISIKFTLYPITMKLKIKGRPLFRIPFSLQNVFLVYTFLLTKTKTFFYQLLWNWKFKDALQPEYFIHYKTRISQSYFGVGYFTTDWSLHSLCILKPNYICRYEIEHPMLNFCGPMQFWHRSQNLYKIFKMSAADLKTEPLHSICLLE